MVAFDVDLLFLLLLVLNFICEQDGLEFIHWLFLAAPCALPVVRR